jgi:hypothetical protein
LLETVRLYAQQKLIDRGEAEDLRKRHLRWYVDNIGEAGLGPGMLGLAHMARYRQSYDNIRAAIDWALTIGDHDAAATLVIAGTVQNFLPAVANLREFVDVIDDLASVMTNPTTQARLLLAQAWHGWTLSDPGLVQRAANQALPLARQADDAFVLVQALAFTTFYSDDRNAWERNLAEARAAAAASGSAAAVKFAEAFLDGAHYKWSDMERLAREVPQRLERRAGVTVTDLANLNTLTAATLAIGDTELAGRTITEIETVYLQAGLPASWWLFLARALIAATNGDVNRARTDVEAARKLDEAERVGPVRGEFLLIPAVLAAQDDRFYDCAVLLAAIRANPVPSSGGHSLSTYRSLRQQTRASLTEEELTAAEAEGQQLTAAVALATF